VRNDEYFQHLKQFGLPFQTASFQKEQHGPDIEESHTDGFEADADILQLNAKSPEDEYFAHTLINYARAKQESETLVNAFALYQTGLSAHDLFNSVVKRCFPRIEQEQIDELYAAIQQEHQS